MCNPRIQEYPPSAESSESLTTTRLAAAAFGFADKRGSVLDYTATNLHKAACVGENQLQVQGRPSTYRDTSSSRLVIVLGSSGALPPTTGDCCDLATLDQGKSNVKRSQPGRCTASGQAEKSNLQKPAVVSRKSSPYTRESERGRELAERIRWTGLS
ncbi:hypothetical protein BDP55DRAFT_629848 [Colletotrichum godetiae]|uniref:Uncharacterized protein n=1 Tax=Colletotrichum godetiae TaxID=1209918 RepID=A0AAJ0AQ02_9PEZI|nr:uncharacterized protein BDP55DRAFT_629848 [Colletotrichum godetiae]KAK1688244.1 hypothetical protein BDP55DRAFT_629848 [Colletotrichum godetiae]